MQPCKFLSNRNNISLLWNTDGVPVFKSSKYSIWPLYFIVNKLPIHKRWNRDNMILGGLWFVMQKLNMLTCLKPFAKCLSHLQLKGAELFSPDIGKYFTC